MRQQALQFRGDLQQAAHLIHVQYLGQLAYGLGGADPLGGVAAHRVFAQQVVVQRAQCGQHACDTAPAQAIAVQTGHKGAHPMTVQCLPLRDAARVTKLCGTAQVAAVVFQGAWR